MFFVFFKFDEIPTVVRVEILFIIYSISIVLKQTDYMDLFTFNYDE